MKDLNKNLVTVALVAAGVVAAGYAMNAFKTNSVISDARKGFTGS